MTQLARAGRGMGAATIPTADAGREAGLQGLPQPPAAARPRRNGAGRARRAPRRPAGVRAPAGARRARAARHEAAHGGRRLPTLRRPQLGRARAWSPAAHARPHRQVARCSRWSPGSRSRRCCSWSPPRSSAATSRARSGPQLDPGPLPAHRREHDPRARLGRAHEGARGARHRRPEPRRTRSCCCASAAARTPRSRSRATRSSTSPATARNKINAAYAFGGPALATQTVKQFLGIEINHVVEVELRELPAADRRARRRHLQGRLRASRRSTAGARNGGTTLRLKRGRDRAQRQAGARARPHAQEPVRPERGRPRRAPAASSSSSRR